MANAGTLSPTELGNHRVICPRWDEVAEYLLHHADLAPMLPAICEAARKEFGPEAELELEVYKDPEIDDRYLSLCVRLGRYEPNFMDRIEAVSEQFNAELEQVSDYFLIVTDFRKPRGRNVL